MSFNSRTSMALGDLSELLLTREAGDSLPPRQDLAREIGVGVGTLTKALEALVFGGAVELKSIQGAGTVVESIDYVALWGFAGRSILRGQLPMNLSVQMEAIEVAVGQSIAASSLDIAMVYREGASRRMRAVADGMADFAIVSSRAAATQPSLSAAFGFGPQSYYGSGSLYLLRRDDDAHVTNVGVDEHSPDHIEMVNQLLPGTNIVAAPFRLIPAMIIRGDLDATIWYGGTALPVEYVSQLRSEQIVSDDAALMASEAVIVVQAAGAVGHLLSHLDQQGLKAVYDAVLAAGPSIQSSSTAGRTE